MRQRVRVAGLWLEAAEWMVGGGVGLSGPGRGRLLLMVGVGGMVSGTCFFLRNCRNGLCGLGWRGGEWWQLGIG